VLEPVGQQRSEHQSRRVAKCHGVGIAFSLRVDVEAISVRPGGPADDLAVVHAVGDLYQHARCDVHTDIASAGLNRAYVLIADAGEGRFDRCDIEGGSVRCLRCCDGNGAGGRDGDEQALLHADAVTLASLLGREALS